MRLVKKGTDGSVHGHLSTSDHYLADGDRVVCPLFQKPLHRLKPVLLQPVNE